jgi:hypothetical protein
MAGDTCAPVTRYFYFGPIRYDHWYDVKYQVNWSSGSDGFVKAYVDGVLLANHTGPTLYRRPDGTTDHTNFELVNYRSHSDWNSTIYFDDVWIGSGAS